MNTPSKLLLINGYSKVLILKIACPKDADRKATSVDLDQTAPTLFAQTCLSKYFWSFLYSSMYSQHLNCKP